MDEGNPYKAPSFPAVSGIAAFRHRDWCSWLALALACILPGLILWDVASRWVPLPQLPMGNMAFNIVFTIAIFLLTMVSVPFGFMGLRSGRRTIAAIATVLGIASAAIIFYVKFYPLL
jgi:hypothetical protein